MADIVIEQAIALRSGGTCQLLAHSPGFQDEWQAQVERLAAGFGERPDGLACPAAVFAQPLDKRHVAIVQAADQGSDAAGRPIALGFHFLIVPRDAYTQLWGNPFLLADRVTPAWQQRGELPSLNWPAEPLPPRTVREVQQVLQQTKANALVEDQEPVVQEDGEESQIDKNSLSPALLGGVQILVDGGRLVFERPGPEPGLIRGLWTLMPASTRNQVWPATFAFGNALGFDALIVPPGTYTKEAYPGYTDEDQACEYPQGYYELNLQIAAEAGNQAELDALFGRRSVAETWRLALTLLVVIVLLAVAMNVLQGPGKPKPDPEKAAPKRALSAVSVAAFVGGGTLPFVKKHIEKADREVP